MNQTLYQTIESQNQNVDMQTDNIQSIVRNYIVREFMYDKSGAYLTNDTRLIEEGIIDSMGIFVLIAFLEEQFHFTIEPENVVLESFETVSAISKLVKTRLAH
ncbi:MAG: acyl carrier protein [Caldilineaceae bacterium]